MFNGNSFNPYEFQGVQICISNSFHLLRKDTVLVRISISL